MTTLAALVQLGLDRGEQLLFHTPHLEDKYKGTRMILDMLRADSRTDPTRICIDHCEETYHPPGPWTKAIGPG